jgi:DNA-binding PadR family transcriptional regulator
MSEPMYYILLALRNPIFVESIFQEIMTVSRGRVQMGPGTLFALLNRMEKQKLLLIRTGEDGQHKAYRITAEGLEALKKEYALLLAMVEDGRAFAEVWY